MFDSSIKFLFDGIATDLCLMKPSRIQLSIFAALLAVLAAGCAPKAAGDFQGYIEGEYVYIAAPLGGTLTNLAVARGDSVKAGQLLFELERASEAATLDQAEKNLTQVQSAAQLSETTFQRRQELRENSAGVVSAEELDKARAQRDNDVAQVAGQNAAREKARWAFDQKHQAAPADAQVHDTLFRQGEWVAAGSPVVSLLPPGNLKVRFFAPQEKLPQIKIGASVAVKFDGAAKTYSATVNYISTSAEFTPPVIFSRETRANLVFMIEAKFPPADAADLRPGQPVDVELK
jgi:HlyD family secretion protein